MIAINSLIVIGIDGYNLVLHFGVLRLYGQALINNGLELQAHRRFHVQAMTCRA